jgi:hypothetical protein
MGSGTAPGRPNIWVKSPALAEGVGACGGGGACGKPEGVGIAGPCGAPDPAKKRVNSPPCVGCSGLDAVGAGDWNMRVNSPGSAGFGACGGHSPAAFVGGSGD